MVDFIILSKNQINPAFNEWERYPVNRNLDLLIRATHHQKFQISGQTLIIIGDCINTHLVESSLDCDVDFIINELKGNFYAILFSEGKTTITSSAFGLLPIYYQDDFSVISSSVHLIYKISKASFTENKKWIVNQLLFNYQFFNDTYFNEIKLFPSLSYLKIDNNNFEFHKYFDVGRAFVEEPMSWKKSIGKLSDLFIETTEQYIPQKGSVISFTGGFDGRTLVSVATHFNRKFTTFSYGKKENDDVSIPLKHSEILDLPYFWIDLDMEYSKNNYSESAVNFIENTDGTNGLLSAHTDYSARRIKDISQYLIAGVCGSELFRAAHSSGAVTSKALLDLFSYDKFEDYQAAVLNSYVFKYLNKEKFESEINELIRETWDYKSNLPDELTRNQKLYIFVYEEIFRKFFGKSVTAQMKYINVRTPYIDFEFFKQLLKTELAGAYSDFLTENPLKRFKGQVLYTDIIKKTNHTIYHQTTGKGYAPRVVREKLLRPLLFVPFITKRFHRKTTKTNLDNLGIISGIKYFLSVNSDFINAEVFDSNSCNQDIAKLSPYTPEKERDVLLNTLSIAHFRKQVRRNDQSL